MLVSNNKCILTIHDEVNCTFTGLPPQIRNQLIDAVKVLDVTALHTPAVKMKRWDGRIPFMNMGGSTYINMIDRLIPILQAHNIDIELVDNRIKHDIVFDPIDADIFSDVEFAPGHHMAGKKIKLRDHQVRCVNSCLDRTQGIIKAATGAGKAQPLYAKVLTPVGWVAMGDLTVGDMVMCPDGTQAAIDGIYKQGFKPIAKIHFADGRVVECCPSHLWEVNINGVTSVLNTTDMVDALNRGNCINIPVITGDIGNHCDDIIDPFLYGSRLTESTINNSYLGASFDQRAGILTGLLDERTIKTLPNDVFEIDFDNEDVAKFFTSLLWSLGYYAKRTATTVQYQFVVHGLGVTKIDCTDKMVCQQCISIDHPRHLYITDDYIVTHNTLITAALSKRAEKYGRSLVIVPSVDLVEQTLADYQLVGLDVGVYHGDKKEYDKTHTICTWQSLNALWKRDKMDEDEQLNTIHRLLDGTIAVIVDECHKSAADVLTNMLAKVMANIPLRWGLTGTIPKNEAHWLKVKCNLGDVIVSVSAKELQDLGYLAKCIINVFQLESRKSFKKDYHAEYEWLVLDKDRLSYVGELTTAIAETGNTLILVDRVETGKALCGILGLDPSVYFIHGNKSKAERQCAYSGFAEQNNYILVATYGVCSTGISINRIFNLVLFESGKSFTKVIQSIGRGLRVAADKDYVQVYDICGTNHFSGRHLKERIEFYDECEYPHNTTKISGWSKGK